MSSVAVMDRREVEHNMTIDDFFFLDRGSKLLEIKLLKETIENESYRSGLSVISHDLVICSVQSKLLSL
jgi:hypothetical protein